MKIKEELKLIGVFAFSIAAVLPIPFKFNAVFHYLPYFYLGVYVFDNTPKKCSPGKALAYLIVFLLLLVLVLLYRETHPDLISWQKVVLWYLKQLYAVFGTLGIYFICSLVSKKQQVSIQLLQFNACCFGIYIFHQFILEYLYYFISLPLFCGTYWLPWCGLLLALLVSFGLTWLLRRIKIGKFLLG